MVFGFFRKESVFLGLDEIELPEDGDEVKKLESLKAAAMGEFSSLLSQIHELHSFPSAGYASVLKNKYCERAIPAVKSASSWHDFHNFGHVAADALQAASSADMKEFRHLHAFKGSLSAVAAAIKRCEQKVADFNKVYSESRVAKHIIIRAEIEKIKRTAAELAAAEKEVAELGSEMKNASHAISDAEAALAAGKKQLEEINKSHSARIYELSSQRAAVKQKLATELGTIGRVLKKHHHNNPSRLLAGYVSNPADAFLADETMEIAGVLDSVLESIELGRLDAKGKETKLREVRSQLGALAELRERYAELDAGVEKAMQDYAAKKMPAEAAHAAAKREAEIAEKDLLTLGQKKSAVEKNLPALRSSVASGKEKLGVMLGEVMGKNVRVN